MRALVQPPAPTTQGVPEVIHRLGRADRADEVVEHPAALCYGRTKHSSVRFVDGFESAYI